MAECYFFAALPCEAKPLISHYTLKKELSITAFTVYRNANITLTVTGLGKSAMSAGVAYTMALFPASSLAVMINIGIAGHHSHTLGSVFAAEKITDQETGHRYYPQWVIAPACPTIPVMSVAQTQDDYPSDTLYEMEASAFYETAVRFSSCELIHSIKVVSDNQHNPSTQIKPAKVSHWLSEALATIDKITQQLEHLANLHQKLDTPHYTETLQQWHFTSSEKSQLLTLLNKRAVLIKHKPFDINVQLYSSAKELMNYLRTEIDTHAFGGFS